MESLRQEWEDEVEAHIQDVEMHRRTEQGLQMKIADLMEEARERSMMITKLELTVAEMKVALRAKDALLRQLQQATVAIPT
jgi:hypothetical protein